MWAKDAFSSDNKRPRLCLAVLQTKPGGRQSSLGPAPSSPHDLALPPPCRPLPATDVDLESTTTRAPSPESLLYLRRRSRAIATLFNEMGRTNGVQIGGADKKDVIFDLVYRGKTVTEVQVAGKRVPREMMATNSQLTGLGVDDMHLVAGNKRLDAARP